MVTIKELKFQIAKEKAKKKRAEKKFKLEVEKTELQKELKKLRRKPSTVRNIKLVKRTGRGLKIIGKKTFKAVKRQAIRIREQQLRDDALARRDAKRSKKKKKRRARNLSDEIFQGFPSAGI